MGEGHHVRLFEIAGEPEESPDRFAFTDKHGDTFELLPITLELYEKHVRPRTMGKPKFDTLEALLDCMQDEW